MILHGKALVALLQIVNATGRYFTNAIQVKPDGTLEATDGNVALSIQPIPPGLDDADFPTAGFTDGPGPVTKAHLLPRAEVEAALKATSKKATIPILAHVQLLQREDGGAVLRSTDLLGRQQVNCDPESRSSRFPNIQQAAPKADRPEVTVHLGIPALESLIKAAKKLNAKAQYLTLHIGEEYKAERRPGRSHCDTVIRVDIPATSEGLSVTGLLMPYAPPK